MHAILDLLLIHLLIDRSEEMHIDRGSDCLSFDAGLNAGKCLPLEVIRPSLELIDELVVPHHLHVIDLALFIIRVTSIIDLTNVLLGLSSIGGRFIFKLLLD